MKKSLNVFWTIVNSKLVVWSHSSKHILVIRNTWDKYFYFSFDWPKHISIRDWELDMEYFVKIFEAILYIWQLRKNSVLVSNKWLLNFSWITPVWVPWFSLTWCYCGLLLVTIMWISYVSCDVWSLFSVPNTKRAKILSMFHTVVLMCSVILREICRLKFCFLIYLSFLGLIRVQMDWAKGSSFLLKLFKEAATKS